MLLKSFAVGSIFTYTVAGLVGVWAGMVWWSVLLTLLVVALLSSPMALLCWTYDHKQDDDGPVIECEYTIR